MSQKGKQSPLDILRGLVYLVAVVCGAVLAITGFYPVLIKGEHISGYLMMLHATCAPVFAACMAALAVMWAGRCRFERLDCPLTVRLVSWLGGKETGDEVACGSSGVGQKALFWLLIVLSLPLILSIVLSMFPLFGTHYQNLFLGIHRYVAAVFVLAAALHMVLLFRTRSR
jgi:cytochrome b subunit of formate dehydrogenase